MPLPDWPGTRRLFGCSTCLRVLTFVRDRSPEGARIVPLFDLVRYLVTFSGAVTLFYALFSNQTVGTVVTVISTMLAIYGATDFTNGLCTLRSGIDRTFRKLREESTAAVSLGLARLVFGALTVWLAMVGFLIV